MNVVSRGGAPAAAGTGEAALVARWAAGAFAGRWLRTAAGEELAVLFPGRRGGPAGPDFRDAVLLRRDGARLCGDVEVHRLARGWRDHGHARDPRYDRVVLHVVGNAQGARATPLASGGWAALLELDAPAPASPPAVLPPMPYSTAPAVPAAPRPAPLPTVLPPGECAHAACAGPAASLPGAFPPTAPTPSPAPLSASPPPAAPRPRWPCADPAARAAPAALGALLRQAGDARFAARADAFAARLAAAERDLPSAPVAHAAVAGRMARPDGQAAFALASPAPPGAPAIPDPPDRVLLAALAEGLAYGRDREPLRRAGEWLAGGGAPDALLRELPRLPALDAARLEDLLTMHARWGPAGPWAALLPALEAGAPAAGARALIAALALPRGAISRGRAAILAANVVLPCAAARAAVRGDAALAARAGSVYAALPGLPSNQITREMARQLGLPRQPAGARAQQGLHHVWAEHCREKRCHGCPCAR